MGIIGLPNAGKSTLFKALTKKQVDIADYPFTTIEPNIGIVLVPDKRLQAIVKIISPEKVVQTYIKFIDIAGLVKDAHKGEGLGNQFLSHIRPCHALVEVVRIFNNPDPKKDIETIKTELLMKDRQTEDNVLSSKPKIYVFNIKNKDSSFSLNQKTPGLLMDLKLEEEASELSLTEKEELGIESRLNLLIENCYKKLNLITFFTVKGNKETRAWTLKQDNSITEAAAKVHTDFAEKFIKAEVLPWQKLIEAGSWAKAREQGKIKLAGKEYSVQDGDIIEFKI